MMGNKTENNRKPRPRLGDIVRVPPELRAPYFILVSKNGGAWEFFDKWLRFKFAYEQLETNRKRFSWRFCLVDKDGVVMDGDNIGEKLVVTE